jgi:hypothetical protein
MTVTVGSEVGKIMVEVTGGGVTEGGIKVRVGVAEGGVSVGPEVVVAVLIVGLLLVLVPVLVLVLVPVSVGTGCVAAPVGSGVTITAGAEEDCAVEGTLSGLPATDA